VWQREETEWSSGSWLRELAELVLGGDWLRSLR
jgi:hypothetical protein